MGNQALACFSGKTSKSRKESKLPVAPKSPKEKEPVAAQKSPIKAKSLTNAITKTVSVVSTLRRTASSLSKSMSKRAEEANQEKLVEEELNASGSRLAAAARYALSVERFQEKFKKNKAEEEAEIVKIAKECVDDILEQTLANFEGTFEEVAVDLDEFDKDGLQYDAFNERFPRSTSGHIAQMQKSLSRRSSIYNTDSLDNHSVGIQARKSQITLTNKVDPLTISDSDVNLDVDLDDQDILDNETFKGSLLKVINVTDYIEKVKNDTSSTSKPQAGDNDAIIKKTCAKFADKVAAATLPELPQTSSINFVAAQRGNIDKWNTEKYTIQLESPDETAEISQGEADGSQIGRSDITVEEAEKKLKVSDQDQDQSHNENTCKYQEDQTSELTPTNRSPEGSPRNETSQLPSVEAETGKDLQSTQFYQVQSKSEPTLGQMATTCQKSQKKTASSSCSKSIMDETANNSCDFREQLAEAEQIATITVKDVDYEVVEKLAIMGEKIQKGALKDENSEISGKNNNEHEDSFGDARELNLSREKNGDLLDDTSKTSPHSENSNKGSPSKNVNGKRRNRKRNRAKRTGSNKSGQAGVKAPN